MRKVLIPLVMVLALVVGGCAKSSSSAAGSGSATTSAGAASASSSGATGGVDATAACPTSNTTRFAKTKFVTHAGLAFGAFHRYLYKPYRAGTFTTGSTRSKAATVAKAAAAALFIKREVRLASEDVRANPTLCRTIGAPLASLQDSISSAVTSLKRGDTSGITSVNSQIAGIESGASRDGDPITENQNATIS